MKQTVLSFVLAGVMLSALGYLGYTMRCDNRVSSYFCESLK